MALNSEHSKALTHTLTSEMKALQAALALALLVASTLALKCNVGSSGTTGTCASIDLGSAADTCYTCTVTAGGQTATTASGCLSASNCNALKAACGNGYTSCTTDNCNRCSPTPASGTYADRQQAAAAATAAATAAAAAAAAAAANAATAAAAAAAMLTLPY